MFYTYTLLEEKYVQLNVGRLKLADSKIIDKITNGKDRKVIDLLYKEIFPNVKSYIIQQNGKLEEAEDCFQEAILKFYKQVLSGEFNPKYKIHGYIYTISIRLWQNIATRNQKKIMVENFEDIAYEFAIQPEREVSDDKTSMILSILNQLGQKCKDLLYHTIYSDMINEDLMHRLEYTSISAVKMQHKRCKSKLITYLEENPTLLKNLQS